ncbi:MAG: hypothetical protein K9L17_04675 [Clostridiales bacterium]|nr:hypothetical protein [Clostridiales bacterium]MCF8021969.1 hypothetical protein [Clostridiales bacterium]
MYGVAGKAAGSLTATPYNFGKEIKNRKQNGQNFWQAMQDITGTNSRVAATTQATTVLAMSPLGSKAAGMGKQATGRALNTNMEGGKTLNNALD